ncbi:MAG: 1-deoxy-D-xylulose-5-phosphate synthase [Ruminococcaceae bacterium]|jgi:1-deoxy-D-xylulose-5-phosphate synthase|nr:1-deoxy-D-xylulose-5-phosphate synthase [Oscillospiraceae bacterium]
MLSEIVNDKRKSKGAAVRLSDLRSPADLRSLPEGVLPALAEEIRETILSTVAANGGHFASNMGAVELTVALHRCFDTPDEKIVFDVGHQSYAHKLLTGRAGLFYTLRRYGGLSGFTNREESPFDAATAGHSGSSLSAAVGMAAAERLSGSGRWTVAVVGDGSFTNGMIYEALNTLEGSGLKVCVVLNDNEMSISKNVGGLSRHLSAIRTSGKYFAFKLRAKRFFSKVPLVGGGLVRAARSLRDFVKRSTGSETFFEKLGLEYIGPVDGNDVVRLIRVLEEAKTKDGPVVVHVVTKKGKGYPEAEAHPDRYHSVGPFDPAVGVAEGTPSGFTAAVSDFLCKRAEEDSALTAVTAAMTDGCGLAEFARRFPERFFDVGIAEEHAAATAGGMALSGLNPVLVLYATFAQRIFDQLWHDVALQKAHITLCLSHAGIVPGDGVTHQGLYDVALLSRIPGVTIRSPASPEEIPEALDAALGEGREKPREDGAFPASVSVIRYPKGSGAAIDLHGGWIRCGVGDTDGDSPPTWRRRDFGPDPESSGAPLTVIVTYGRIVENVVPAAEAVFGSGENADMGRAAVVLLSQIVPLPEDEAFRDLVRSADRLLFVEEGIRSGGVGESLASAPWLGGKWVRIRAVEIPFLPHGSHSALTRLAGLDAESLAEWMKDGENAENEQ